MTGHRSRLANCFLDGFTKFSRQSGFEYQNGNIRITVLLAHKHTISGVWVDKHIELLMHLTDGFQTIVVGALATAETIVFGQLCTQSTEVKVAFGIELAPQTIDLPRITTDQIINKALEIRSL